VTRVQSFDLFGTIGCSPAAGLLQGSDGNFYGTLNYEIFKMSPGGLVTILYSFNSLGGEPTTSAPLIQGADGNIYGTSFYGGDAGYGSIFKITPAGAFTQLHSFPYMSTTDGKSPDHAALVQAPDGSAAPIMSALFSKSLRQASSRWCTASPSMTASRRSAG
jgi:uncharacterized repeat protein (TIGR03803 family)